MIKAVAEKVEKQVDTCNIVLSVLRVACCSLFYDTSDVHDTGMTTVLRSRSIFENKRLGCGMQRS